MPIAKLDPIQPNWERAALLTIDMQNDFASPSGAGFVPGTDQILPAFSRLISAFRDRRRPIFHAARLYLEDGSNAERCRQQILQGGLSLARPGTVGACVADAIRSSGQPDVSDRLLAGEFVPLAPSEWLFISRAGVLFTIPISKHVCTI